MGTQLEVIKQQESIKNTVTEEQKVDVDNFVNELDTTKNKKENIINIFDKKGPKILEAIFQNTTTKIDRKTIDDEKIIYFNTAILAFEKDLAEYSKKKGGDLLDDDLLKVEQLKKTIIKKQAEKNKNVVDIQTKIDVLSKNYETQAEATRVFEENKDACDATMLLIYNTATKLDTNQNIKILGTTGDELTFTRLFKLYAKGNKESPNIGEIKIGKGKYFSDSRFNESEERVIQYEDITTADDGTVTKKETKHFVRGKDKDLQTIPADKYIPKKTLEDGKTETYDISKFNTVDRTSTDKGINIFDDKGNYVSFGRFLEAKGPEYTKIHFNTIVDQIVAYTPKEGTTDKSDGNITTLKNGYGTVFTEYILKNPNLLETYCTYLTPDKMNLFGGDRDTRVVNFNKLADNTAFQAYVKTLSEEQQKKIVDLRASIAENKPSSLKESLKTIGNAIASLMMMFGLGKGSLKKRLPESMRKEIDEIYAKEFKLDEDEKNAIDETTKELDNTKKIREMVEDRANGGLKYTAPKAADLKRNNKITTIAKEYYQYLDPKIIRQGIEIYNKDTTTKLTENNFIIKQNNKEELNISGIKSNPTGINAIISALINDDATWTEIASANEKIFKLGTKTAKDGTVTAYSEFFEKTGDREGSIIQTEKNVGTYLVSYLFAGGKNLSYTITENNLINGEISKNTGETKTEDRYQAIKDTKLYQDTDKTKITEVKTGTEVTVTTETTLKTGAELALTDKTLDAVKFRQVKLADGTIGWIEDASMEKVETTSTEKTLSVDPKYLKDEVLTGVGSVRIDEIMTNYATSPDNLLITPKGATTAKKIQKGTVKIGGVDTPTYVYTDTPTKRVIINDGDKIEATTETTTEVAINTTWEIIDTNLNDTKKSTEKTNFEKTDYALNDKNTYQTEIIKLSELFTDKDNYKKLIADKITIEDIASVTNITHLKNMFTYRKLKSTKETENETFKGVKDFYYNKLTNIDPTKQTYEVTATEKDGIQITAKESGTKKFTISIKNTDGKMSTGRKDETAPV